MISKRVFALLFDIYNSQLPCHDTTFSLISFKLFNFIQIFPKLNSVSIFSNCQYSNIYNYCNAVNKFCQPFLPFSELIYTELFTGSFE